MRLFKYVPPESGLKMLVSGLIRFSPPQAFNDPFELKPNIKGFASTATVDESIVKNTPNILRQEYDKLPQYFRNNLSYDGFVNLSTIRLADPILGVRSGVEILTPVLRSALESRLQKITGILCLTEKEDNLLMWAHYAASHSGFVVEFDVANEYFKQDDSIKRTPMFLKKVEYFESRPALLFSGLRAEDIFLAKSRDWEYEQEWRMFAPLEHAQKIERVGDEEIHLFEYPRNAVCRVILGCKASIKTETSVRSILDSESTLAHVELWRASIDLHDFKLNFHKT